IFYLIAITLFCKVLNIKLFTNLKQMKSNYRIIFYWILIGFSSILIIQFLIIYLKTSVIGIDGGSLSTTISAMLIKQNILAIINPILIAPIFEELVFRRVIFKELHHHYPFWFAGSVSAILFSILHGDIFNILLYYIAGMILAYIYKKSDNIMTPIITHILLNAVPIILILFNA